MKRKHNDPDPGPRRKKSHRRNPAAQSTEMSIHQPMSFVMPAAMTAAGYFAANYVPTLLGSVVGTSAITRIGVKAALGVVSPMFLKGRAGMFLAAGVLANAALDAVNTFLFPTATTSSGFETLGALIPRRTIAPHPQRVTPPLGYTTEKMVSGRMQGFGIPAGYSISPYTVAVPSFPS